MNELGHYVEQLFFHYRKSDSIAELKEEILGNLEARKSDLISEGYGEEEATRLAEQSITSVDGLIDGNKKIKVYSYRREWMQWLLIYLITACIAAVPMLMVNIGTPLSTLLFFTTVVILFCYIHFCRSTYARNKAVTGYVNYFHFVRLRKLIWFFWCAFTLVYAGAVTGMYFGSTIWFSRRVSINGPYELAVLVILYAVPLFSLVIPLTFHRMPNLILKYEVKNHEET